MGWYALEEIDGTLSDVKEFLLPFNLKRWLKLAVIVFFIGASFTSFPGAPGDLDPGTTGPDMPDLGIDLAVLAVIAVAVVGVIAVFSYLSSVFEFIFYQSLVDDEVKLKDSFGKHYFNGLKLFGFNILVGLVGMATLAVLIVSAMYSIWAAVGIVFLMIPVWLVLWLVSFFVRNVTVPEIVVNGKGFMDALRETWSKVRVEWRQSLLFIVFAIALSIGASVVTGTVVIGGLLVMAIPLVIIGILFAAVWPPLVLIPVLIGILGLMVVSFGVSIPVQTYIYRWVLNVYQRFDS